MVKKIKKKKVKRVKRIKYEAVSKTSFVKDVDLNWKDNKQIKGGVIPYTIINNKIYFALGIDSQYGDITDFGGGITKRIDEDPISGTMREFSEESFDIFIDYFCDNLDNQILLYNDVMLIIFLQVDACSINELKRISRKFDKLISKGTDSENSELVWLNLKDFIKIINKGKYENKKLYYVTRGFLKNNPYIIPFFENYV